MRSGLRLLLAFACLSGMPGPNGSPLPEIPFGVDSALAQTRVCRPGERSNTPFGELVNVDVELRAGQGFARNIIPAVEGLSPASLRLQVEASPSADAAWTLQVRDAQLRLVASVGAADLRQGTSSLWTGRLDVPQVGVELIDAGPSDVVRVRNAIVYESVGSGGSLFSIQGDTPNWRALHSSTALERVRAGDVVGMMVGGGYDAQLRRTSWCCSGVMLAPSIYLTNWHCGGSEGVEASQFWNRQACGATLIDLAWDQGSRNRQYRCIEVLHMNEALDFALLRVGAISGRGGDDIAVRRPHFASGPPSLNEALFMIHHPLCQPKRISSQNCSVRAGFLPSWRALADGSRPASDFSHTCDSESGSSGAPMFNEAGQVIGLHHLGFEVDRQCRPVEPRLNRAVSIQAILAEIARARPDVAAEIQP